MKIIEEKLSSKISNNPFLVSFFFGAICSVSDLYTITSKESAFEHLDTSKPVTCVCCSMTKQDAKTCTLIVLGREHFHDKTQLADVNVGFWCCPQHVKVVRLVHLVANFEDEIEKGVKKIIKETQIATFENLIPVDKFSKRHPGKVLTKGMPVSDLFIKPISNWGIGRGKKNTTYPLVKYWIDKRNEIKALETFLKNN